MSAAILQALESSRFKDLPEPIFVLGYLRAYARLLEMDGDVLVAEYDRMVDTTRPVLTRTTKDRRRLTARNTYIRGATAWIVVAMVVLLGSWWYIRVKHDLPTQPRTVSPESEQPVLSTSVLPPPRIDSKNQGPGPVAAISPDIPPQSRASEPAGESAAAVEPEPPVAETTPLAQFALPVVTTSSVTANADAVVQRRDVKAIVESAVQDLPIAPLVSERGRLVRTSRAPTGEDVLVVKANDESWAEVVDANGYQLLYYPLRPGMVLRLQGQAPFRVFLGNAPAVDVSVNQKRFDHTPFHRRKNTALFLSTVALTDDSGHAPGFLFACPR